MNALAQKTASPGVPERIAAVDWSGVYGDLDAHGGGVVEGLLSRSECVRLSQLYGRKESFRSRVVMGRHGFGRGEYKYFAYPLPEAIAELRASFYPRLVSIANRWSALMGCDATYPEEHASFLDRCHEAGQLRPTPLLLEYAEDDYNCLHQDVYGEHVFPLQWRSCSPSPGATSPVARSW